MEEEDTDDSEELEADRIMEEWKEQQDQVGRGFKYFKCISVETLRVNSISI